MVIVLVLVLLVVLAGSSVVVVLVVVMVGLSQFGDLLSYSPRCWGGVLGLKCFSEARAISNHPSTPQIVARVSVLQLENLVVVGIIEHVDAAPKIRAIPGLRNEV